MTKEALKQALEALDSKYILGCGEWRSQQNKAITAIKEALAQQEPVQTRAVHITWNSDGIRTVNGVPDYTPPAAQPQRTWVGLTHEQIGHQAKKSNHEIAFALGAFWAEARLKEKNT